jgi:Flp pilus assembly pilin Flp
MAAKNLNTLFVHFAHRILDGPKALRQDRQGQDLIEYALMAASISLIAAGIFPSVYTPSMSTIWSKVGCVLSVIGGS